MGAGAYLSYFIEEQTACDRYHADAERKSIAATGAVGTPKEAALKEEASIAMSAEESVCDYARQSKQNGMLMMLGGLISLIASVALLILPRRAGK